MDPVSLTASILTLIEGASTIYRLVHTVRGADKEFATLCVELGTLADFLKAIKKAYEDFSLQPLALVSIGQDLWTQCRNALMDCQGTLDELDQLVKRMKAPHRSNTVFRRTKLATEMRIHSQAIVSFRDRIRMSIISLQTILQVMNVSLALQHNASQSATLHELQKLSRHLEESKGAAANQDAKCLTNAGQNILQHAQELIRAARTFHDDASSKAGGSLRTPASGQSLSADGTDAHYAESGIPSKSLYVNRDRIEMYLLDSERANKCVVPSVIGDSSRQISRESSERRPGPSPSARFDIEFRDKCSKGLSSMAQKAIDKLEFVKAEELLRQALKYHKVSGLDDTQHKRLRTQLALCSFLQRKGTAESALILDMAEFAAGNDVIIRQLLYALALEQLHELNLEAANEACQTLWKICQQSGGSENSIENEIWRLIALSQRESGTEDLAEAIEEMVPGLDLEGSLPSTIQFIVTCEELLLELFGGRHDAESQKVLGILLQTLPEATNISAFQKRQVARRATNASGRSDGFPSSSPSSDQEADDEASIVSGQALWESSPRKQNLRNRRLRRHDQGRDLDFVSTSTSSTDTVRFQTLRRVLRRVERTFSKDKKQLERYGPAVKPIRHLVPIARRRSSHASRISRVSGTESDPEVEAEISTALATVQDATVNGSSRGSGTALGRTFSFGPTTCDAEAMLTCQELAYNPLFELMDTSPRMELDDTGLSPADIVDRSACPRSQCRDSIEGASVDSAVMAAELCETEHGSSVRVPLHVTESSPPRQICAQAPCANQPWSQGEITASERTATEEMMSNKHGVSTMTALDKVKIDGGETSAMSGPIECQASPGPQLTHDPMQAYDGGFWDTSGQSSHHSCKSMEKGSTASHGRSTSDGSAQCSQGHHFNTPHTGPRHTSKGSSSAPNRLLENTDLCMSHHIRGLENAPCRQPPSSSGVFESTVTDSGYDSGASSVTSHRRRPKPSSPDVQAGSKSCDQLPPQTSSSLATANALTTGRVFYKWYKCRLRRKILESYATPKPIVGLSESLGRRTHRNGLTYEYFGPTALPGPYTLEATEMLPELERPDYGLPERPRHPGDIAAPIELDTSTTHNEVVEVLAHF